MAFAYPITLDAATAASQNEGNPGGTAATFTFHVDRGLEPAGSYDWKIINAADYSLNTTDFTVSAGSIDLTSGSADFTITAVDDVAVEGNESFAVWFYPSGGTVALDQGPTITLINDDAGAPVFSNTTLSVAEGKTDVGHVSASGSGVTYTLTGGGADHALFTIDSAGALTFTGAQDFESPADTDGDNVYEVEVEATAAGATTTETIKVSVTNVNEPITITSNGGGATATLPNVDENTTAVLAGNTATDIDAGDSVAWSISGGADASAFQINPLTGALSFKTAPNFEHPTDSGADHTYVVDIRATDSGGLNDTQTLTVTVNDIAEPPTITSNGGGAIGLVHYAENGTAAVTTVTAVDDDGPGITYGVGGADAGAFHIDAATGVLTFAASPDYEAHADANGDNVYEVTLSATDGTGTDTQAFYVFVDNVAEATDGGGGGLGGGGTGTGVPSGGGGTGTGGGTGVGGSGGNDKIVGTDATEFRGGGAGDDTIDGAGGDDWLDGDDGNDSIQGGTGDDFIRGLNDQDTVFGGAGDDTVNGNMGQDSVHGGDGADVVYGGQGEDTVYGGAGDDPYVNGNIGNDIVHGGDGGDSVYGGQNNDTVYGDGGDDQVSGDLGDDILFGGAGRDLFAMNAGGGHDWAGDFNAAEGDRILLAAGTSYTVVDYLGQAVVQLSTGETLGLAGVATLSFDASWVVFGS